MASTIQLTNTFTDRTTRQLNIGTIPSSSAKVNPATLKANINTINADPSTFAPYYLSTGGASFASITAATIINESVTEIPL